MTARDETPPSAELPPGDRIEEAFPRSTGSFFRPGEKPRPQPAPGLEPGKVVGDFRLTSMIGQGGMGQVWEAQQISLGGRKIAIKFVRPERVTAKQLEYFEREARAGGRLSHPGLVAVHGYGESDGLAWIAMELVEGTWTLRDFLDELVREDELPPDYDRHVARFVRDLARALHAAHEGGVIHRDLKPQNVLITPDNTPKVTDFGLARITDESALSQTGDFAGTYYYMSPEQVAAKRMGIDHRTDIFSLGVVLYEMLTLARPFQGDTSHQVAQKIVLRDPPPMRSLRSRIPRDLVVICGKALEKDPNKRFRFMADLAEDLERHLSNRPILAQPPTRLDRTLKWVRRNPTRSAAAAVASVAFVVISWLGLTLAQSNAALETKTTELTSTNASLEQKTEEAEASALMAQANAEEARDNARLAEESAAAEKRRADEVLRLSLAQDYMDLVFEADRLWPPHPDRIDGLQAWMADANELVGQLPALLAKREELRRLAPPLTEEERLAERDSHPEFARLGPLQAELDARRGALAVRRGEEQLELPTPDWSAYPPDAIGLDGLAWPLVDPQRESFGQEALGLVLATRAAELAPEEEKAGILESVAWGRLAVGDDAGALEAGRASLEAAPAGQREEFAAYWSKLEAAVAAASSAEGLAAAEAAVADLESTYSALEARVNERRTWNFPQEQQGQTKARWWHNQLSELIGDLESLTAAGTGLLVADGVSEAHGWSVPRRLAMAERLRDGFAEGGAFDLRWERDLPAIRESYPGLALTPQAGLVPIGVDPASKLWEFWHVPSGTEPLRREDGVLALEDRSGLVFVLLSGGKFWMGASADPNSPHNYDENAGGDEGPVHEVELSAFFLSKYEMTQGQWDWLAGKNPSRFGPTAKFLDYEHDWTHPVEQVSWLDSMALLPRFGLQLPSEAQWEYGARGGTDTPWWTGRERETLRTQRAANLADQAVARAGATWPQVKDWPELDDGYAAHAPVDEFSPNPYGLHNVHGNVMEECLDGYDGDFYGRSGVRDPVRPLAGAANRVSRGGSLGNTAFNARTANRYRLTPSNADSNLGLRPARVLTE